MEIVTATDLIQEIRELSQEQNEANPTDAALLRMLSRGQRFICSEIGKVYAEPFLAEYTPTALELSNAVIPIPKDAWEDRVLMVEFKTGAQPYRIPWRRFDQTAALRLSTAKVPIPYAVYIVGREIRFAGSPTGAYSCVVTYLRGPEPFVAPQGRVTSVGAASLAVDQVGDDISTDGDDLASYFNVIDFETGRLKGTFQVASLPTGANRVNVRTTPQRATVQSRAVSSASALLNPLLPTGAVDTYNVVVPDDYICPVRGSCMPFLGNSLNSYLVEYVCAELSRSLDTATAQLSGMISEVYRKIAEQQDIGRGTPLRVKNTSKIWSRLMPIRFLPGSK